MRERLVTFALALAALVAFYALWLNPAPTLDPDKNAARPTTAERRGNGYAGLYDWLARAGVPTRSFRERYTALPTADVPARGNLLVLSLPGLEGFHNDEFGALDRWVRHGNTLLINVALLDQPGWAAGRASAATVEIESLTGLEFETKLAREARLDDTPLAQRVREADARRARKGGHDDDDDDEEDEDDPLDEVQPLRNLDAPTRIALAATGPHPLLAGVHRLALESDYAPADWSLRMPYDDFVLTLARTQAGEGAVFEQRLGAGRILLVSGGSLFTNRVLGVDDNARLFSNIVAASVARGGVVLFDDLRQGLSASYDPARFFKDSRLWRTVMIVLGTWFVWVLGSTRLRAPAIVRHDPSEAELVRHAGALVERTVAPHLVARRLFDQFFDSLARVARGGGPPPARAELWSWLEHHAAVLPQELDELRTAHAQAERGRRVELAPLKNLLDTLEKRLNT